MPLSLTQSEIVPPCALAGDYGSPCPRESLIETIYEASPDGVLLINPDGGVAYCSRRFFDIWRIPEESVSPLDRDTGLRDPGNSRLLAAALERVRDREAFRKSLITLYRNPREEGRCEIELKDGRTLERYTRGLLDADGIYLGRASFFRDITDGKQAERAILESEREAHARRLEIEQIYECSPVGLSLLDREFRNLRINRLLAGASGCTPEEVIGKTLNEVVPDLAPKIMEDCRPVLERGESVLGVEYHRAAAAGRPDSWTTASYVPYRNENGEVVGVISAVLDISRGKRVETAFRRLMAEFRTVFNAASDTILIVSLENGAVREANDAACRLTGYTLKELLGMHVGALDVHTDAAFVRGWMNDVRQRGETQFETGFLRRDHAPVPIEASCRRFEFRGEACALCVLRDITERKQAEQRWLESEGRFRAMADGCPMPLWTTNTRGEIQYINQAFSKFNGGSFERVKDSRWQQLLHPDDAPAFMKECFRALEEHRAFEHEARVQRIDGEWRWLAAFVGPRFSPDGEFLGHVGVGADITSRREAEQALQDSEEKFRQLTENIREIFWLQEPTTNEILYISPAYEQVFGRTCASLYQDATSRDRAIHPDDMERSRIDKARLSAGLAVDSEYRIRTPEGREKWIRRRAFPVLDRAGKLIRIAGISEDITEKKQYEAQMLRAQAAAEAATRAKSQFLAAMSHEIRTPMNGVIGMTSLLLESGLSPEQQRYAGIVRSSGEKLLAIINDILDYSRIEAGKLVLENHEFDLDSVLCQSVELLALRAHEKDLDLTCHIAPAVPRRLCGDSGRLSQILTNLVGNAVKFTAHGDIRLEVTVAEGALANGDSRAVSLRFTIADTGIGIRPDRIPALFEPFAQADSSTTRRFGGTGLGLSIAKQLVELMDGGIDASSTEGRGSTFSFTARFACCESQESSAAPAAGLAGLNVLVAGAPDAHTSLLLTLLAECGCRGADAPDLSSALGLLHAATASGNPYHAVLLEWSDTAEASLFAAQVNADPSLAGTALVALFPLGRRVAPEQLEADGFAGSLTRPVLKDRLVEALRSAVNGPASDGVRPAAAPSLLALSRPMNILVAEDNGTNQEVARVLLGKLGCEVTIAANGAEALKALRASAYDVVLMDCEMPGMDGYEATRRIRQCEAGPGNVHIPILAFTADAMSGDRERCLLAGMNDYIAKPIEPSALAALLSRWQQRLATASAAPAAAAEPPAVFRPGELLDRLLGDERLGRQVVSAFLSDAPSRLRELTALLQAGDLAGVRLHAHSLKGAAASIAAAPLSQAAKSLEDAARAADLPGARSMLLPLQIEFDRLERAIGQWNCPDAPTKESRQ